MKSTGLPRKFPDTPAQSGEHLLTIIDRQAIETAYTTGQVIAGKYRVERVIGEGAMGVVLAATHLDLDEMVAIKLIRPEMQQLPDVVSRFAREAKATVRIKSEHIANVIDVGIDPSLGPYIVMEYLDGKDLARILAERGPLPVRRAVEYAMQTCEALALAHASGTTHRDIKPENLFLTRKGELEIIKVLDFGISKAVLTGSIFGDDLANTETQCLMGTPLYMSPEQIRSTREVDPRTDIWSLGAVLYELISGKTAFAADSITQMCAMVLETTPQPLIDFCENVTPALQAVIDRCLDKDANGRYQNIAELALALMPFGPSRARLHADRAASILRAVGVEVDLESSRSSFPASGGGAFVSTRMPTAPRVPTSISSEPSVGARSSSSGSFARSTSSEPVARSLNPTARSAAPFDLSAPPEIEVALSLSQPPRRSRVWLYGVGAALGLVTLGFLLLRPSTPATSPVQAAAMATVISTPPAPAATVAPLADLPTVQPAPKLDTLSDVDAPARARAAAESSPRANLASRALRGTARPPARPQPPTPSAAQADASKAAQASASAAARTASADATKRVRLVEDQTRVKLLE